MSNVGKVSYQEVFWSAATNYDLWGGRYYATEQEARESVARQFKAQPYIGFQIRRCEVIYETPTAAKTINQLHRELEEVKKERDKFQTANARHVMHHMESFCEKCCHVKGEDGCANCILSQLAASEAKCERLKYWAGQPVSSRESQARLSEVLAEPPSTSLDLYHKERNKKELGEVLLSSKKLGSWLSAALDDGQACNEFKADIRRWFASLDDLKRLKE